MASSCATEYVCQKVSNFKVAFVGGFLEACVVVIIISVIWFLCECPISCSCTISKHKWGLDRCCCFEIYVPSQWAILNGVDVVVYMWLSSSRKTVRVCTKLLMIIGEVPILCQFTYMYNNGEVCGWHLTAWLWWHCHWQLRGQNYDPIQAFYK